MTEEQLPLMTEYEVTPEALTYRLFELRWTLYKLAQEYSATVGTNSPASRYHSSLGKILANPNKSSLETIKTVVQALRGELIIRWYEVSEDEKGTIEPKSTEERLENLESLLLQVLQKFSAKESGE